MGTRKQNVEEWEEITQLAQSWGKIVVRQEFGDGGPGLDVDWISRTSLSNVAGAISPRRNAAPSRATARRGS